MLQRFIFIVGLIQPTFLVSAATTPVRGYFWTNAILNERLLSEPYELGSGLLGQPGDIFFGTEQDVFGVLLLLGGYEKVGADLVFVNPEANGVSVLLWKIIADSTTDNLIATSCLSDNVNTGLVPKVEVRELYRQICQNEGDNKDLLESFWYYTMRFDAPFSEFEIFQEYFGKRLIAETSLDRRVALLRDMLRYVIISPYFLLDY